MNKIALFVMVMVVFFNVSASASVEAGKIQTSIEVIATSTDLYSRGVTHGDEWYQVWKNTQYLEKVLLGEEQKFPGMAQFMSFSLERKFEEVLEVFARASSGFEALPYYYVEWYENGLNPNANFELVQMVYNVATGNQDFGFLQNQAVLIYAEFYWRLNCPIADIDHLYQHSAL